VVAHDRRLGRISGGEGRLARLTVQQLQDVDGAYWWVDGTVSDHHAPQGSYRLRGHYRQDRTLRIPTLHDVLTEFPDEPLTIEVKAFRAAKPLLRVLQERSRQQVTITSFFTPIVWQLRRLKSPEIDLAPATAYNLWFWLRVRLRRPPKRSPYQRIQVPFRQWGITFLDDRFIESAHRAQLKVDAWTINDANQMHWLIDHRVDGIMTDRPSLLADVVNRHGPLPG
jgi:glycerophosphoryl diester phosphodiesterase